MVYTFTVQGLTSDEVQAKITDNDGILFADIPWQASRGFEDAGSGVGAVIEVADPADKSSWIGTIEDVETQGDGYPMHFMIQIS